MLLTVSLFAQPQSKTGWPSKAAAHCRKMEKRQHQAAVVC